MAANEADSREKLAADMLRFVREMADEAYVMGEHEASWYPNIGSLGECIDAYLDRQAAITERELCSECGWPAVAAQPDRELQDRMAELEAERDELRQLLEDQEDDGYEIVERLNAELDAAKTHERELHGYLVEKQRVVEIQRESFLGVERRCAELARLSLGLWRRMDALRLAGRAPSLGDVAEMAARLAQHGIEAS